VGPDLTKMAAAATAPEGSGSSEVDAAKDLIAAVKAGDATAANLALKRHYEACYG
jgi:DNA-binding GntR family transcriptional regulator